MPGGVRGPLRGHEAFHCLRGRGILRVWPAEVDDAEPVSIPLGPGSEYYVRGDVTRTVENTGDEPLFGIGFLCHVDRPCHAHAFSHSPGEGNFLHYHGVDKWVEPLRQEFVEAMYLIESPGFISTADPLNTTVEDHAAPSTTRSTRFIGSSQKRQTGLTSGFTRGITRGQVVRRPACLIYLKWQPGAGRAERPDTYLFAMPRCG